MGCCSSAEVVRTPSPPPQEEEKIHVPPSNEPEDPRAILLISLFRLAKSADPNFPESKVRQFCGSFEKRFEMKTLNSGKSLAREGSSVDGLYVVISGELSVTDARREEEVMRIFSKDFYFDVEIVYDKKSLYDVSTYNECKVWVIPADCVRELFVGTTLPPVLKWFVRRRYPPNLPGLNKAVVYNQMYVSVMQQVPLFSNWQESTIEAFIEYMGEVPMLKYQPKSLIVKQGSEPGDMYILVRGRVDAYEAKNKLVTFLALQVPFIFGEEGVFNQDWEHRLTVVADAPCYLISINKKWIWHASENVWEFAEGAEPHWTNAVKKWNSIIKKHSDEIYSGPLAPFLTIELLYQWLRCTASFRRCQSRYVYELAKCGNATVLETNDYFPYSDLKKGCLLVLKGQLQLVTEDQISSDQQIKPHHIYKSQELVYFQDLSKKKLYLQGRTKCLLIKFPTEDIRREMQGLPTQPIDFLEKSDNRI